jgi:hypothetical protein
MDGGGGDGDATTSPDATPDSPTEAAVDAGCTGAWLVAPTVPSSITPDAGVVILHALGSGTQDYACVGTPIDGGADAGDAGATFKWTLTGPNATLSDCNGNAIGSHFASEGGAGFPEWMTVGDSTYVVGQKVNGGVTPDSGTAVNWLLLRAVDAGGSGPLSTVTYVQRLDTDGGLAPATGCDFDASGATQNVSYTADYYFYGP